MSDSTKDRVAELTRIDQNLQQFLAQKQQFQSQLVEIDNALSELEGSEKSYKIVGNIMVSTTKERLQKELGDKKEVLELRIKAVEKQEEQLKAKADELRKVVFEDGKTGASD
ncbi:prefoldin subunit beta [Candidatus Woesearchaeota archaeon]|nr:prefoldin subunit beta [Candidatus Woesearchaeota archaeon]